MTPTGCSLLSGLGGAQARCGTSEIKGEHNRGYKGGRPKLARKKEAPRVTCVPSMRFSATVTGPRKEIPLDKPLCHLRCSTGSMPKQLRSAPAPLFLTASVSVSSASRADRHSGLSPRGSGPYQRRVPRGCPLDFSVLRATVGPLSTRRRHRACGRGPRGCMRWLGRARAGDGAGVALRTGRRRMMSISQCQSMTCSSGSIPLERGRSPPFSDSRAIGPTAP